MKLYSLNTKHGTLIDSISGNAGTNSGFVYKRSEKGFAIKGVNTNTLIWTGALSGVKTIMFAIKKGADSKLFLDDSTDKLEITGGSLSGTGLTQAYIENIDTDVVANKWQFVIAEFSAGIDFATNFKIAPTSDVYLGFKIVLFDSILTPEERADEMGLYLHAHAPSKEIYPRVGLDVNDFKPTDLSRLANTGLVAAYNMIPSAGGVLTDISGEGNNGTITGGISQTSKGLKFSDGLDLPIIFPSINLGSVHTLCFYLIPQEDGIWLNGGKAHNDEIFFEDSTRLKYRAGGGNTITFTFTALNLNEIMVVIIARNGTSFTAYAGNQIITVTGTTGDLTVDRFGSASGKNYTELLVDAKIYSYAFSEQQAKNYHNSFVKPVLIADYTNDPVGSTRPFGHVPGTGAFEVKELVIEKGNLATVLVENNGWTEAPSGTYTFTSGLGNSIISQVNILTIGKRYKLSYRVVANPNSTALRLPAGLNFVTADPANSTVGYHSYEGGVVTVDDVYFRVNNEESSGLVLSDITVHEIPPLQGFESGTKYLECTSAGTIAIPSKSAYGAVEFDWYKGADGNTFWFDFIADTNLGGNLSLGYGFVVVSGGTIFILKTTGGAHTAITQTAPGYTAANTLYRTRITISKAGVFTLLIKGGAFTPTAGYDGWTLVSVVGGAGANPTTDTTYKTSNYITKDVDAGDRIARVKWFNEIYIPIYNPLSVPAVPGDYFLPSKDELDAMRTVLYDFGVGGLSAQTYWSSTEQSAAGAIFVTMSDGASSGAVKGTTSYHTRACRSFTAPAGSYSLRDIGPSGGLIFIVSGTTYYETYPTDQAYGQVWSNITTEIGVTAQGTAVGDGITNTAAIIGQAGHTTSAAKLCDDLN